MSFVTESQLANEKDKLSKYLAKENGLPKRQEELLRLLMDGLERDDIMQRMKVAQSFFYQTASGLMERMEVKNKDELFKLILEAAMIGDYVFDE